MSTSAPSVPSNPTTPMSEFEFYFQFTKPLVLYLPSDDDKTIAAAWVQKLEIEPDTDEQKRLRLDYLKLLLFILQRGRLGGVFKKPPPSGNFQPFPQGFRMADIANLMIDQDDAQTNGGGDGCLVPYVIDISNDLREFVAAQEVPNFGVQMYYAWSSDESIHNWTYFDEKKFPKHVIDKIKLLKESQSSDKTGSKVVKKPCDFVDTINKNKVKSPEEIEQCQGRTFQTYLGLMRGMGSAFKKCDPCADKTPRSTPRCAKKSPSVGMGSSGCCSEAPSTDGRDRGRLTPTRGEVPCGAQVQPRANRPTRSATSGCPRTPDRQVTMKTSSYDRQGCRDTTAQNPQPRRPQMPSSSSNCDRFGGARARSNTPSPECGMSTPRRTPANFNPPPPQPCSCPCPRTPAYEDQSIQEPSWLSPIDADDLSGNNSWYNTSKSPNVGGRIRSSSPKQTRKPFSCGEKQTASQQDCPRPGPSSSRNQCASKQPCVSINPSPDFIDSFPYQSAGPCKQGKGFPRAPMQIGYVNIIRSTLEGIKQKTENHRGLCNERGAGIRNKTSAIQKTPCPITKSQNCTGRNATGRFPNVGGNSPCADEWKNQCPEEEAAQECISSESMSPSSAGVSPSDNMCGPPSDGCEAVEDDCEAPEDECEPAEDECEPAEDECEAIDDECEAPENACDPAPEEECVNSNYKPPLPEDGCFPIFYMCPPPDDPCENALQSEEEPLDNMKRLKVKKHRRPRVQQTRQKCQNMNTSSGSPDTTQMMRGSDCISPNPIDISPVGPCMTPPHVFKTPTPIPNVPTKKRPCPLVRSDWNDSPSSFPLPKVPPPEEAVHECSGGGPDADQSSTLIEGSQSASDYFENVPYSPIYPPSDCEHFHIGPDKMSKTRWKPQNGSFKRSNTSDNMNSLVKPMMQAVMNTMMNFMTPSTNQCGRKKDNSDPRGQVGTRSTASSTNLC